MELPLFVREFPLFPRELTKFQTKKGFSILNQGFFATELVKSVTQLTKSVTDLSLSGSDFVFSVATVTTFGLDQGFSAKDFTQSTPDQGNFSPEKRNTQRHKMPIRPEFWKNLSGEIAFETGFLLGKVPANIGAQWRSERHHGDVAGFFQGS